MTIITKVLLTEEEKKIVEQAKNLYDALSKSTLKECKGNLCDDCIHCPLSFEDYDEEGCVLKELYDDLSYFIKGVDSNV